MVEGGRIIKKKLVFGITSLEIGGAERVLVDTANALSEKYNITIFSIYNNGALKKELNNNIKFKCLYDCNYKEIGKISKILIPIKILLFGNLIYNKYIGKNYDTVISFLEGPVTRIFSCGNRPNDKIVWVHNDIQLVFGKGIKSKIKRAIDKNIYDRYNRIVFVSKDNMESFRKCYPNIDSKKMAVINNYIDAKLINAKAEKDGIPNEYKRNEYSNFVCICRLVEQKGIDRLIKVHSKLKKDGYLHNVYVIGDGPEKVKLEKLISNENVSETFKLLGERENPYPYIKYGDYFCLLSYYEGYGMVIEEAKILNKVIIITNTASREAVEDYSNAVILNNDFDSIYEGLKKIISCGYNKDDTMLEYSNNKILDEIINLIDEKNA